MIERQGAKVGCCGFATRQREYYRLFRVVELQSTFYKLPQTETAERWRSEAPSNFEFCLKSWQVITHPATSPTWRRMSKVSLPPNRTKYGHLRPTSQNFEAWEKTFRNLQHLASERLPDPVSSELQVLKGKRRQCSQISRANWQRRDQACVGAERELEGASGGDQETLPST